MKSLLFFCSMLFIMGCASLPADYLDVANHKVLRLDSVIDNISKDRVIFVGEIHGSASIHLLQLEIIRRLRQRGKALIIAVEVFPFNRQEILNKWIEGALDNDKFERAFSANWTVPFDYYEGIFNYAREQHIPLVAMNAEDAVIRKVLKEGPQAVSEDFLKEVQFTDCSTDTQYKKMLNSVQHTSEFPFFCDGQRLRDAVMAFHIAKAMRGNNYTVVVLAGVAHSVKIAVPRILESHTGATCTVLLPEEIRDFIKKTPESNIADYIWF